MILTFTKSGYLFLLLIIPLAILIHFITLKWKRSYALRFANFDAISKLRGIDLVSKNISILGTTILISLLIVFALSGATFHKTIPASSFSFSIAIDSSRSMEATDFSPNRLEAAKSTALNFVDATPPGTVFGIISFSGNAIIEQSPTTDKAAVKQAIRNIELSEIGGTDLSEAVITSSNLLKSEDAKAVILISDGQINVGETDDLVDYANENDVLVHTIGIGTPEGGETSFGLSKLDEDALKASAFNTGGKFFFAPDKETLQTSLGEILELETKKVSIDLTSYLLIATLIIYLIEFILVNTRFKALP